MWTTHYFTPCPVPSFPAFEPNSTNCEYCRLLRHIQYNRTASFLAIATLAILFSGASSGAYTDVASPGYTVRLLALLLPASNAATRYLAY